MPVVSVHWVLAARAPDVEAIPQAVDAIQRCLLPVTASVVSSVLESGRRDLAWLLLSFLRTDAHVHFLDKRRRARLVVITAIRINDVSFAERTFGTFYCDVDDDMLREAVRGSHLEALRWLHAELPHAQDASATELSPTDLPGIISRHLLAIPAGAGDLVMLQTLLEMLEAQCTSPESTAWFRSIADLAARTAAQYGHDDIIDWLRPRFEMPPQQDLEDEAHAGPPVSDTPVQAGGEADTSLPWCSHCRGSRRPNHCYSAVKLIHAAGLGRLQE